ncbi:MAG TPA: hypothetical protein VIK01_11650 [Polyangiaceae bacterium]
MTSEQFYDECLAAVAVSAPVALWLEPWRFGYFGLLQDLRYYASTRYTQSVTRWALGAGLGARFGEFSILFSAFIPDTLGDGTHRIAAGTTLTGHW